MNDDVEFTMIVSALPFTTEVTAMVFDILGRFDISINRLIAHAMNIVLSSMTRISQDVFHHYINRETISRYYVAGHPTARNSFTEAKVTDLYQRALWSVYDANYEAIVTALKINNLSNSSWYAEIPHYACHGSDMSLMVVVKCTGLPF